MKADKEVRLRTGQQTGGAPDASRRSDAVRRREALLEAASRVFLQNGIDAPLEAVIAASGVGRATLYRNFPDRVALVAALIEREIAVIEAVIAENPGARALTAVLEAVTERAQIGSTLADAWRLGEPVRPHFNAARDRLENAIRKPLADAKAAGFVRKDIQAADIQMIVRMIAVASPIGGRLDYARLRKRALLLIMKGVGS